MTIIDQVKHIIESRNKEHEKHIKTCEIAEKYYKTENDILTSKSPSNQKQQITENPLRNADNRIPHNWHGLLVNQKAGYMFTHPPIFDTGDNALNDAIMNILSDEYFKEAKSLCVNASNCGIGWLHVWIEEDEFKYANVDPKQMIGIYSNTLKKSLIAVIRTYSAEDEQGKAFDVYEYWDNTQCMLFKAEKGLSANTLKPYTALRETNTGTNESKQVNVYQHGFDTVPFIEFPNNDFKLSDLGNVKKLIDVYDKIYSGYVNDVEDIQEVIMILTNYGGEDLDKFLGELKRYKAVDLQDDGENDKSGLTPMTIDIPVEARNKLLEITRRAIFIQGQGVDPERQDFSNTSGVALKFVYSLLELKAGMMETEFRIGFGKLVRMICYYLGKKPKRLTQAWSRNMITNDVELAEIGAKSSGLISNKTIVRKHPWVDDVEAELEQMKKEEQKEVEKGLPYEDKEGDLNAKE